MSRINILQTGTQGVDMKTNPLLLGNKKLHAATNLIFDEGCIRTRPGFRYIDLNVKGQFQGACEFRPSRGLSSKSFSTTSSGIAWVVDGVPVFSVVDSARGLCSTIAISSESPFALKGNVNLYQAENYLIIQNENASTYWWDGGDEITQSPGMLEEDWTNPDVQDENIEFVAPTPDIPVCETEQPWDVRYTVIDAVTKEVISFPIWQFSRSGEVHFSGVGSSGGQFVFAPMEKRYFYKISRTGYRPKTDGDVTFRRPANQDVRDDCYTVPGGPRRLEYIVELIPLEGYTPPPVEPPAGGEEHYMFYAYGDMVFTAPIPGP